MTTRTCPECSTALAETKPRTAKFCSDLCRYRYRDKQPSTKAADAARHKTRYHSDPEFRARHNAARTERARRTKGTQS